MKLDKVPQEDLLVTEHGPIYNFLYSAWIHILKLMGMNMLFIIFNIPAMLIAYVYTLYFLPRINSTFELTNFVRFMLDNGVTGNSSLGNEITGEDAAYQFYFLFVLFCVMFFLCSLLICVGPFQAGFSQIFRNMRRQGSVFFFEDFKQGVKENWKQSTAACLISLVFTAIVLFAIGFYANLGSRVGIVLAVVFTFILASFMVIQNIVYQLMVSRQLSLKNLYKNAFLFYLLSFGPCLGIMAIMVLFYVVIPFMMIMTTTYLWLGIYVFLYMFFLVAWVQYLISFITGGIINKYMPPPAEDAAEDEEEFYGEDPDMSGDTDLGGDE